MELIVGIVGASLVLVGFVMIQLKHWGPHSLSYLSSNLAGGLLLLAYAWLIKSWPFVLTNLVWAAVAGRSLLLYTGKSARRNSSNAKRS